MVIVGPLTTLVVLHTPDGREFARATLNISSSREEWGTQQIDRARREVGTEEFVRLGWNDKWEMRDYV